jgi:hypothetical protein
MLQDLLGAARAEAAVEGQEGAAQGLGSSAGGGDAFDLLADPLSGIEDMSVPPPGASSSSSSSSSSGDGEITAEELAALLGSPAGGGLQLGEAEEMGDEELLAMLDKQLGSLLGPEGQEEGSDGVSPEEASLQQLLAGLEQLTGSGGDAGGAGGSEFAALLQQIQAEAQEVDAESAAVAATGADLQAAVAGLSAARQQRSLNPAGTASGPPAAAAAGDATLQQDLMEVLQLLNEMEEEDGPLEDEEEGEEAAAGDAGDELEGLLGELQGLTAAAAQEVAAGGSQGSSSSTSSGLRGLQQQQLVGGDVEQVTDLLVKGVVAPGLGDAGDEEEAEEGFDEEEEGEDEMNMAGLLEAIAEDPLLTEEQRLQAQMSVAGMFNDPSTSGSSEEGGSSGSGSGSSRRGGKGGGQAAGDSWAGVAEGLKQTTTSWSSVAAGDSGAGAGVGGSGGQQQGAGGAGGGGAGAPALLERPVRRAQPGQQQQ